MKEVTCAQCGDAHSAHRSKDGPCTACVDCSEYVHPPDRAIHMAGVLEPDGQPMRLRAQLVCTTSDDWPVYRIRLPDGSGPDATFGLFILAPGKGYLDVGLWEE